VLSVAAADTDDGDAVTFDGHHVPGRLRLRLAPVKGDERAARRACAAARAIRGVIDAAANPATGSLVIHYAPERLAPAGLWAALCEDGLVSGPCPLAGEAAASRARPITGGARRFYAAFACALLDRLAQFLARALVGALL
jgi:hypothetical protein